MLCWHLTDQTVSFTLMSSLTTEIPNLNGAVVVITGGSSGIGFALAQELLKRSIKAIVITGRNQEKLDKAVTELEVTASGTSGAQVRGRSADSTKWDDCLDTMQYTQDEFGHIDYVFANSAAPSFHRPEFGKLEAPDTSETLNTLNSVLYAIHAAIPFLAKSPASDRAVFITGSDAAFQAFDFNSSYAMAKAAMNPLTFSYADILLKHGIRINTVSPSWVLTSLTAPLRDTGGLLDSDFIPMNVVIGAFLRLLKDTSITGVVTRITHSRAIPFDIQGETHTAATWSHWAPFWGMA